jgi:hypothetical protein
MPKPHITTALNNRNLTPFELGLYTWLVTTITERRTNANNWAFTVENNTLRVSTYEIAMEFNDGRLNVPIRKSLHRLADKGYITFTHTNIKTLWTVGLNDAV